MYDPKITEYPYPIETDKHYLVVKKDKGIVFDSKYPYIDNSFKAKLWRVFIRFACLIIGFPTCRIRLHLKVNGKSNLKKYNDVINQGIISVCNHVHMWDFLGILASIKNNRPKILAWDKNINGENGSLIRAIGGIPVPTNNIRATMEMTNQVINDINNGGWLHLYAEGSMWEYYAPIRPFKEGAAYFAVKTNKPILPLAYSYRENKGIYKLFTKHPAFTLNIGEPIYSDSTLPEKEAIKDLTIRANKAVCELAKINDNIYEPLFNKSIRIDYYTDTYGKKK